METPALLDAFAKPGCIGPKFENNRYVNNRLSGMSNKLTAKQFIVPVDVRVDLYMKRARIPRERAASALDGAGGKFDHVKLPAQLMANPPKVSSIDGNSGENTHKHSGQRREGRYQHLHETQVTDQHDVHDPNSDVCSPPTGDAPDEAREVEDEAEGQIPFTP